MDEDSSKEYLTAEQLRDCLYENLKKHGFVDSLKKQLRSALVAELRRSRHVTNDQSHDSPNQPLCTIAVNSLVAEHLRRSQFDYTLSVFLPESALTPDKVMSCDDVMQLLRIGQQSSLYEKLKENEKESQNGFLWHLISELCQTHNGSSIDVTCQTYPSGAGVGASSLHDKLITVEDVYLSKKADVSRHAGLEDRLLAYQRQIYKENDEKLAKEITHFREKEKSKIRLEERERLRDELQNQRTEMDKTHHIKTEALKEKERNMLDRIHKEQEMQSRELYTQRQNILEEIEVVRQREVCAKRELETYERERKLNDDRIQCREDSLKKRELELEKLEREYEVRLQNEMTKFRLAEQAKYADRTHTIEVREFKLLENERRIKEDIDRVEDLKIDLKNKTVTVTNLETQVQELRHREGTVGQENSLLTAKIREMVDYNKIKEENAVMKYELDDIKLRLSESIKLYERQRSKNEELLRTRDQPNQTCLDLQRDLDEARDSLSHQKTLMDQAKLNFDLRLKEEVNRKSELINQLEQQTIKYRELNHEMEDMRQQLMHARNALNNEVFHKANFKSHAAKTDAADSAFNAKTGKSHLRQFIDVSSDEESVKNNYILRDLTNQHRVPTQDNELADADIIAQTKYKLKSLDREAQNLQNAYASFHQSISNTHRFKPNPIHSDDKVMDLSTHRKGDLYTPPSSPIRRGGSPRSSTPRYKYGRSNIVKDDDHTPDLTTQANYPNFKQRTLNLNSINSQPAMITFDNEILKTTPAVRPTESDEGVRNESRGVNSLLAISNHGLHTRRSPISMGLLDDHSADLDLDDVLQKLETDTNTNVHVTQGSAYQQTTVSPPHTSLDGPSAVPNDPSDTDIGPLPVSVHNSLTKTPLTISPVSDFMKEKQQDDAVPPEPLVVESSTDPDPVVLDDLWKSVKQVETDKPLISPDSIGHDVIGEEVPEPDTDVNIDPVMQEYMARVQSARTENVRMQTSSDHDKVPSESVGDVSLSEVVKSEVGDDIFDNW